MKRVLVFIGLKVGEVLLILVVLGLFALLGIAVWKFMDWVLLIVGDKNMAIGIACFLILAFSLILVEHIWGFKANWRKAGKLAAKLAVVLCCAGLLAGCDLYHDHITPEPEPTAILVGDIWLEETKDPFEEKLSRILIIDRKLEYAQYVFLPLNVSWGVDKFSAHVDGLRYMYRLVSRDNPIPKEAQ
jgi:hypothetical protein